MKTIITHKNLTSFLDRLSAEPEFQIGSRVPYSNNKWYRKIVRLEFPLGELAKDWLTNLALVGPHRQYKIDPLTGDEQFDAQGLEGKVTVEKELFSALINLRDILPANRGRIVMEN
jgi:hypothetical protein